MEKARRWQSFKLFLIKLWYKYILRREYRIGWKMTGPNAVIINDEAICKITLKSES